MVRSEYFPISIIGQETVAMLNIHFTFINVADICAQYGGVKNLAE